MQLDKLSIIPKGYRFATVTPNRILPRTNPVFSQGSSTLVDAARLRSHPNAARPARPQVLQGLGRSPQELALRRAADRRRQSHLRSVTDTFTTQCSSASPGR